MAQMQGCLLVLSVGMGALKSSGLAGHRCPFCPLLFWFLGRGCHKDSYTCSWSLPGAMRSSSILAFWEHGHWLCVKGHGWRGTLPW
jgi:hypothetical protein